MAKPLVIYHANCADGFGAAFAAWLKLGDEAEYLPCQYGDQANAFDTQQCYDREVCILDFSFPRMIMDSIFALAKRVTWLDHHKTAFEMWDEDYRDDPCSELRQFHQGRHDIRLHKNKSGAYLAWEYFHPNTEVPMFIRHIDDYDRWVFAMEGTKAFNKAIWSYTPWSFEQWNYWVGEGTPEYIPPIDFYDEGSAILRAHDQNVTSVVKGAARKCRMIYITSKPDPDNPIYELFRHNQYDGLAANCPPHLTSDVGHELANQSGTYGLLWYVDKDGQCRCSLRSNGDYDVSVIAKAFGGGGHKNAAGFTTGIATLLGWIA